MKKIIGCKEIIKKSIKDRKFKKIIKTDIVSLAEKFYSSSCCLEKNDVKKFMLARHLSSVEQYPELFQYLPQFVFEDKNLFDQFYKSTLVGVRSLYTKKSSINAKRYYDIIRRKTGQNIKAIQKRNSQILKNEDKEKIINEYLANVYITCDSNQVTNYKDHNSEQMERV